MNNKIKMMTNLIYQLHGQEGKMYFNEFQEWVNSHSKFLESIQEWFRPSLWRLQKSPKTYKSVPGYTTMPVDLESYELVQNFNSFKKE